MKDELKIIKKVKIKSLNNLILSKKSQSYYSYGAYLCANKKSTRTERIYNLFLFLNATR
jgi:hypothetical protein